MKHTRVLVWSWGRKGGGPRYTFEVARALSGIPSLDVFLSMSRQAEILPETKRLGLPCFNIDTYTGFTSAVFKSLWLPRVAESFIQLVNSQAIDIVLCTMRHPWSGSIAKRLRNTTSRYIYTVHDAFPHDGDEHIGWEWILKSNLRYADGVLVLSDNVRWQLIEKYGYPENRIWMVPHGPFRWPAIEMVDYKPVRPRRLLFFGRILPYKGLGMLVEAFEQVADKLDLQLCVVGHGRLGKEREKIANNPRIILDNRWVPEKEVASILLSSDIVVTPYIEASQSGVIAAAYGMGRPVVATPVGGLCEQVENRKTGIIASKVNARSLAEAISNICTDHSLYSRCREGAIRKGDHNTAWTQIAYLTAVVINEVCAMPRLMSSKACNNERMFGGLRSKDYIES